MPLPPQPSVSPSLLYVAAAYTQMNGVGAVGLAICLGLIPFVSETPIIIALLVSSQGFAVSSSTGTSACRSADIELSLDHTMRVELIGHFEPCMTEIYLYIDARMADYIRTHPYPTTACVKNAPSFSPARDRSFAPCFICVFAWW